MTVVEAPSWAQPILNFLVSRELPSNEILARQVQHRAATYTIVNRELVRCSVASVFQRCVEQEKGKAILRDIHQDITVRYDVPHNIIIDNGTNLAKGALARFRVTRVILSDLESVSHPQSNGQIEQANGLILSDIKPRLVEPLERSASCWIEELPAVL
ncbi:uncharacterized protein [Aegilops tauschii subsp. strangulata]|uniref:uncharacterized protein n=1 Tax=Aegilops tauschii subsp. strangulata TaxID=200361 RepID=UPI003CC8C59B